MKSILLALLTATCLAHAVFAADTPDTSAPACAGSVQSMKAQAPEATYTLYTGDEGAKVVKVFKGLALDQGADQDTVATVDGVLTATLPQEEERTFVALVHGDCVVGYTVAPTQAVKELIEQANGQGV